MNLETKVEEIERLKEKVNNLEEYVNFVSFDERRGTKVTIEQDIKSLRDKVAAQEPTLTSLQQDNVGPKDAIIDS